MTNGFNQGPLGVRKVSERIVKDGRSLIVTDKDAVKWEDVPFGALRIDPVSNKLYIKSYDNVDDWTEIEFGKYIPDIPDVPKDLWESGDIPLGDLTREEAEAYLSFYEAKIKEIEVVLTGFTTDWLVYSNLSDRARQCRSKIIDIFEGLYTGSSSVFAAMKASDMSQVINVLKTGIDILIEIISGLASGDLSMTRLRVGELYEIVYPGSYVVNDFTSAEELADDVRELYAIIGSDAPEEISETVIETLTDAEIGTLLIGHLDIIESIFYNEVVQARFASKMRSLAVDEEPIETDDEKEELLKRIQILEEQVLKLTSTM